MRIRASHGLEVEITDPNDIQTIKDLIQIGGEVSHEKIGMIANKYQTGGMNNPPVMSMKKGGKTLPKYQGNKKSSQTGYTWTPGKPVEVPATKVVPSYSYTPTERESHPGYISPEEIAAIDKKLASRHTTQTTQRFDAENLPIGIVSYNPQGKYKKPSTKATGDYNDQFIGQQGSLDKMDYQQYLKRKELEKQYEQNEIEKAKWYMGKTDAQGNVLPEPDMVSVYDQAFWPIAAATLPSPANPVAATVFKTLVQPSLVAGIGPEKWMKDPASAAAGALSFYAANKYLGPTLSQTTAPIEKQLAYIMPKSPATKMYASLLNPGPYQIKHGLELTAEDIVKNAQGHFFPITPTKPNIQTSPPVPAGLSLNRPYVPNSQGAILPTNENYAEYLNLQAGNKFRKPSNAYQKMGGEPCYECGGQHMEYGGQSLSDFPTETDTSKIQSIPTRKLQDFLRDVKTTAFMAIHDKLDKDPTGERSQQEGFAKKGGKHWIQGAVKHPGRCTPGSPNYDCPKGSPQWRLAQTFKKHHGFHKADGGTLEQFQTAGEWTRKDQQNLADNYYQNNPYYTPYPSGSQLNLPEKDWTGYGQITGVSPNHIGPNGRVRNFDISMNVPNVGSPNNPANQMTGLTPVAGSIGNSLYESPSYESWVTQPSVQQATQNQGPQAATVPLIQPEQTAIQRDPKVFPVTPSTGDYHSDKATMRRKNWKDRWWANPELWNLGMQGLTKLFSIDDENRLEEQTNVGTAADNLVYAGPGSKGKWTPNGNIIDPYNTVPVEQPGAIGFRQNGGDGYPDGQGPLNRPIPSPVAASAEDRYPVVPVITDGYNSPMARNGSEQVRQTQQALNRKGANLAEDGAWGPKTQAAWDKYVNKKSSDKKTTSKTLPRRNRKLGPNEFPDEDVVSSGAVPAGVISAHSPKLVGNANVPYRWSTGAPSDSPVVIVKDLQPIPGAPGKYKAIVHPGFDKGTMQSDKTAVRHTAPGGTIVVDPVPVPGKPGLYEAVVDPEFDRGVMASDNTAVRYTAPGASYGTNRIYAPVVNPGFDRGTSNVDNTNIVRMLEQTPNFLPRKKSSKLLAQKYVKDTVALPDATRVSQPPISSNGIPFGYVGTNNPMLPYVNRTNVNGMYKEGGEYYLDEKAIEDLRAQGYELDIEE